MSGLHLSPVWASSAHPWLKPVRLAFVPGPMTPLLELAAERLLKTFRELGHSVQEKPDSQTDLVLTTATFAQPLNWREALLFTMRARFHIKHTPTLLTLIHASAGDFQRMLDHFGQALRRKPPRPEDFTFAGLSTTAYEALIEQGLRGGPIMALERLLQTQSKSIRILLFIGEDQPEFAHLFDLVGAYPRCEAEDESTFYTELALRLTTALSTHEVTRHQVVGDPLPFAAWKGLNTPAAMLKAASEFDRRLFFTPTVVINKLVQVPAIGEAVADQYSEGCFATWEIRIPGLIATVTGSARPVDKGRITEDDLAIITGVREDGSGALVRQVDGRRNDLPSSEAVEMMEMDQPLPRITLAVDGKTHLVPVIRSKLHGHRGIAAYNPNFVEFIPLDPPFYHYPVSCATQAQAEGIRQAFGRADCLLNPDDPRQAAFTVLPGHGVVMVEKWQAGKEPFQLLWEYMDAGYLQIDPYVPQGMFTYGPGEDGQFQLSEGRMPEKQVQASFHRK